MFSMYTIYTDTNFVANPKERGQMFVVWSRGMQCQPPIEDALHCVLSQHTLWLSGGSTPKSRDVYGQEVMAATSTCSLLNALDHIDGVRLRL
jgi:hypothetical protein